MSDADAVETYSYLTKELRDRFPKLAYIHVVEPRVTGDSDQDSKDRSLQPFRDIWSAKGDRPFFSAGGHTRESAEKTIENYGGAVVFGRHFVANPDLPVSSSVVSGIVTDADAGRLIASIPEERSSEPV